MSEPRIIAEVRSQDGWDGLVEALRLAHDDLNTTYRVLNEIGGFASGHVEKLLAPPGSRNGRQKPGRPRPTFRDIGPVTFGPLLGTLGVKILVVIDEPALAFVRRHPAFKPRNDDAPSRHTSNLKRKGNAKRRRRELLPSGRAKHLRNLQILAMTPQERSRSARHAAVMRWNDVKAAVAKAKAECVDAPLDKI